jgi:hypothetical protein
MAPAEGSNQNGEAGYDIEFSHLIFYIIDHELGQFIVQQIF